MIQFFINQISRLRFLLYKYKIFKTHTFKVPIISVGNIESGGTGKTPMVSSLIKILESKNKKVCVISRGYGRKSNQTIIIDHNKKYTLNEVGDEPFALLKENPNISMVIGDNKIKAIKMAIKKINIDVIILDDGFQSLYIKRDLDIVMVAHNKQFSREPYSALRRADAIITKPISGLTRDIKSLLIKNNLDDLKIPLFYPRAIITLEDNQGGIDVEIMGPSIGVCGIAGPNSFREALLTDKDDDYKIYRSNLEKIIIKKILTYKDHHNYSENDMKHIYENMQEYGCKSIITTTKDYDKLVKLNIKNIKIYKLKFEYDIPENNSYTELHKLLDRAISSVS